MDGRRHEALNQEALRDEALDRELEAMLDVDPSPSFVARTRARLDAEPIGARRPLWMAAGGVAALVAGAALVWPMVRPAVSPTTESSSRSVTSQAPLALQDEVPPAGEVVAPERAPAVAVASSTAASDQDAPGDATEPEVLIPEGETRGFAVLLAHLDQGLIDGSMLSEDWGRRAESSRVVIDIVPIEIVPLTPLARPEGERP